MKGTLKERGADFLGAKSIQIEQGGLLSGALSAGVHIRPLKRTHRALNRSISLLYVDVKDNA